MILKWFAEFEQVQGAPGLDLPGLDVAAVASGYGVPSREMSGYASELIEALLEEIAGAGRAAARAGARSRPACGWTERWRAQARWRGLAIAAGGRRPDR